MNLRTDFIDEIKQFNGKRVTLAVIQITAKTHPIGAIGCMMMGPQQNERILKADKEYSGYDGFMEIEADMELVKTGSGYHAIFIPTNSECNCIEVFRPNPPLNIGGTDMSLWWSYHPLTQHEIDKLVLLKDKFKPSGSTKEGDCHPIRELFVNRIQHCK